jgi:hypothetical protein
VGIRLQLNRHILDPEDFKDYKVQHYHFIGEETDTEKLRALSKSSKR